MDSMISEYQKAGDEHKKLVDKYDSEKSKLDDIERTLGASSEEYKAQQKVVEELSKEVSDSEKAYDAQGKAINEMRIKVANAETKINKTAMALDSMGQEAEDASKSTEDVAKASGDAGREAQSASDGFTVMKGVLANLASQAIMACINGLKELGSSIADTVAETASLGDEIDKESQKLGISTDVYQELSYAMERSGASIDDFRKGMRDISDALADAQNGVEGATEKYDALGISLSNADGSMKSTEDVLLETIDALASMEDVAQRNALANDIFGKSYQELAPLLNSGSEGIRDLMNEAQEYGMVMSGDAIKSSAGFQDAMTKLKGTIDGLKNGIVGEFLPAITTLVDGFTELAHGSENAGELIQQGVDGIISKFNELLPQAVEIVQQLASTVLQYAPMIIESLLNGILGALPQLVPVVTTVATTLTSTLLSNIPLILDTGFKVVLGLINGIKDAIPTLTAMLPTIITETVLVLTQNFPLILDAGISLLQALCQGILSALPDLISQLPLIIDSTINTLLSAIPLIIDCGTQLLMALVDNLDVIIDQICAVMPDIINSVISALLEHLPEIVQAGITLFVALVENTPYIISQLLLAVGQMLMAVIGGILSYKDQIFDCGKQIIKGLWDGIVSMKDWLLDMIKGLCDDLVSTVTDFFDIQSPSRLMRDLVGKNLAKGIGIGYEEEMDNVNKEITDANEEMLKTMQSGLLSQRDLIMDSVSGLFTDLPQMKLSDINISHTISNDLGEVAGLSMENNFDLMVNAFKEALSEVKIEMDDEEMGRFVDTTVTKLVYA
jgi:phage-related protein/uncharacterized protein YukE